MSITTWGKKNEHSKLISEVGWDKSGGESLPSLITARDGHVSRQCKIPTPFSFLKTKSKGLPALINLTLPLLSADHTQRRCQGHKFRPHHYLLLTMFIQASSVGGNRWCVWQVFNTGQRSAWLRVQTEWTCVSTVKSKHVGKREESVKWLKGRRFRSCLEKSLHT